jgi:hypothetical protein
MFGNNIQIDINSLDYAYVNDVLRLASYPDAICILVSNYRSCMFLFSTPIYCLLVL